MAEGKKPVTLKQGMPPEQANGMYSDSGANRILALGVNGRFQTVVTFEVADIIHSEKDDTTRPVVEMAHIEPIWDAEGIEQTKAVQESSYKERTGANQLNFEGLQDEGDEESESEAGEQ